MKVSKKLCLALSMVGVLTLSGCNKTSKDPIDHRGSDEEVYESVGLATFKDKATEAGKKTDADDRMIAYAEAEAHLLDSAVMLPTTTKGGNYAATRVVPYSKPYASVGNDEDRFGYSIVVKGILSKADYNELSKQWATGSYDPKAYLDNKGIEYIKPSDTDTCYTKTFTTAPVTLDIVNTSEQSDTEILVNMIDGLVQYDNMGVLKPNIGHKVGSESELPEPEPVTPAKEGEEVTEWTVTYELRNDVSWVDKDGKELRKLKASDFVDGFQHMLDSGAGLDYLVDGVVKGVHDYLTGETSKIDTVGIKANNTANTLTFTILSPEPFFNSRLAYSCFSPMHRETFEAKGGAFGIENLKEAKKKDTYTYGKASDPSSMAYNGAYYLSSNDGNSIVLKKNTNYFNKDKINFQQLKWIITDGKTPDKDYEAFFKDGNYEEINLLSGSGLLDKAKKDGNLEKYGVIIPTTSSTYLCAFNTNRGTWNTGSVKSTKTTEEKEDTMDAMKNKNFRKALAHGWDRATWNAVSVGDDLKLTTIRNTYTKPDFTQLKSEKKVVIDGEEKTYPAGTKYSVVLQDYLNSLGTKVEVADGQDGWYKAEEAKKYMEEAIKELKASRENATRPWPEKVYIDLTYYGASAVQTGQAQSYKKCIDEIFKDYGVEVRLNNATTLDDFYACGYRAKEGKTMNYDVSYGTGWGPDYEDVSSYVDTFLPDGAGYMTKIIGLF